MKTYIYSLKDPITEQVMYVGRTTDVIRRFNQHLTETTNRKKSKWVLSLKEKGQKPVLKIIEECEGDNWQAREVFHIQENRRINPNLLNVSEGGAKSKVVSKFSMIRFNMFVEPSLIELLESKKIEYGFPTVSSFIRYIIIKFFNGSDK